MATTSNVLSSLGTERICYREMQNEIGILCSPRSYPSMIDPGLTGYKLGLHNEKWIAKKATQSGAETYYVRVVPIYDKMSDPDGNPLMGTPNTENTTKGVTFDFEPFPDGYPCTGYRIYAGTVSGTLYYQGTLDGRFLVHFVIGTTWTYLTTGAVLTAQTVGVPPFASCVEVYQSEGAVDSRVFLGGGRRYSTGYARVAQASSAPIMTCGKAAEATYNVWDAITDGSFRMMVDGEMYDFTGINFNGIADMDGAATVLQNKIQSAQPPTLYGGTSPTTTIATWAAITDGSFSVVVGGTVYNIASLNFSACTTMAEVAAVIQTGLQASFPAASVRWDSTATRFIIKSYDVTGGDQIVNGVFAADTDWTKGTGWTISGGKANYANTLTDVVTNGAFTTDTGWTKAGGATISGGKANFTSTGSESSVAQTCLTASTRYGITLDYTAGSATFLGPAASIRAQIRVYSGSTQIGMVQLAYTWGNSLSWIAGSISITSFATDTDLKIAFILLGGYSTKTGSVSIDNVVAIGMGSTSLYQTKSTGNWNSKIWSIQYTLSNMDGIGERVRVSLQDTGGHVAGYGQYRSTDGTFTDLITTSAAYTFNRIYFTDESTTSSAYSIDGVSMTEVSSVTIFMSHFARHTSATGTDISTLMACRGDSTGVILNRTGKAASAHTVTWSTDHFIITGASSGSAYRLSYLEAAKADVGTDISVAAYMDGLSTSVSSVYTPGKTLLRTVEGEGTDWWEWAEGMKFRIASEGEGFLIQEVRSATELLLDEDYEGDGYTYQEYLLEPYDAQAYISDLGNPFHFNSDNIVALPTSDSDGITAIKKCGRNIAIIMQHHIWMIDSVDITAPRMISSSIGAPCQEACIEYENGLAMFTGEDFVMLSGGRIESLDPDGRMREICSRISSKTPYPHGVSLTTKQGDLLMWWIGLDDSDVYNVRVVFDPKRANWWLYNDKNASASAILRDDDDKSWLLTGNTYDWQHAIPAFTLLHSSDYRHDGASSVSTTTKQGVIATGGVGTATTTAGYLTCATAGSVTYTDWTGITTGYFKVTIDEDDLNVGPCDFSTCTSMATIAAVIQTALRAVGGGLETCTWSTDHFIITSGTLTNRSDVDYLRPYLPASTSVDLSGKSYMNGREDFGVRTGSQNYVTLTLRNMANDTDAALYTTDDAEKGCYLYICDTNGLYGQYARVISNTANTVTVTPSFTNTPAAGWYWYIGGIVPTWVKWTDFGASQHKNKVHGFHITIKPESGSSGNRVFLHGMQDLSSTIRTYKVMEIGGTADTVGCINLKDKPATQHGFKLTRPSSSWDLKIEDITVIHAPEV